MSIVTEAREDFAEQWKTILDDTMIKAGQILIKSIPVKVDSYICDYWKK